MKNTTARPSPSREASTPQLRRVRATGRRHRGGLVRRMLMLADAVGLTLAFAVSIVVFRTTVGPEDPIEQSREIPLFFATLPGWILLARLHGLYDRDEERASHSTLDDLVGVFHLVTVGAFLFFAASWVTGLAKPYPPKLLTFWAIAIVFVALARVGARAFARTRSSYVQNAVIVGVDPVAKLIARKILRHDEYGVNIVGFVDPASDPGTHVLDGLTVLGPPDDLPEIVRSREIERVVVAFFDRPIDEAIDLVRWAKNLASRSISSRGCSPPWIRARRSIPSKAFRSSACPLRASGGPPSRSSGCWTSSSRALACSSCHRCSLSSRSG